MAGEVLCGVLEASLQMGIRKISVVCEALWVERLRALGWKVDVLGERLLAENCEIVGALIEVTQAAIDGTKRSYGIEASVLHPSGDLPPFHAGQSAGPE